MRVSSLSNEKVLSLVSQYFVPTWLSGDHYQLDKPGRDEQDLLARINTSRRLKRVEGGAVCVYIVTAKGEVLASLPVGKACNPNLLAPFLRKVVDEQKLQPRNPADARAGAASAKGPPKPATSDGHLFTIRTRFDTGKDNRGTSRDVVELTKAQWSSFLPPSKAHQGTSYKVSHGAAEKLLKQGYPPLPHWKADLARVKTCELTAKVSTISDTEARLWLEGKLELIYPYQGKPTDGRVTARLVGMARCDLKAGKLTALALTSDGARYVWYWQGKAFPKEMSLAVEMGP
jgi:hypothetical protein